MNSLFIRHIVDPPHAAFPAAGGGAAVLLFILILTDVQTRNKPQMLGDRLYMEEGSVSDHFGVYHGVVSGKTLGQLVMITSTLLSNSMISISGDLYSSFSIVFFLPYSKQL